MSVLPYHDTVNYDSNHNAKFVLELKNEKKAKVAVAKKARKGTSTVDINLLRAEHTVEAARFTNVS
jgi:hypothetical protein